jgi:glycosyltransferase involved in cell wall biosynthesis
MNTFVVIPAYNEEQKIGEVIENLLENGYSNIVIVDDCSSDNTMSVARQYNVAVLEHVVNRGQGAALETGTQYSLQSGADIIVHYDADGQMAVENIADALREFQDQSIDVVLGSRYLGVRPENMPQLRKLILFVGRLFNFFVLGIKLTDPQGGFRVLRRSAAKRLEFKQDRMAHCSQLLQDMFQKHMKIKEIPVKIIYTEYSMQKGQANANALRIVWNLFLQKLSGK